MKSFNSESAEKFYLKLKKILTPTRRLLLVYLMVFMLGALLLWLPFTHQDNVSVSFIDALFTSGSAFSDTGLSVFDATYTTFNFYGQFVIFVLIILGGLGLYTLKIFVLSFFVKKFTYKSYQTVSSEMEAKSKKDSINMIRTAFFVSIFSVVLFGLILALLFYLVPASNVDSNVMFNDPKGNFSKSLWMGLFTSASSLNNAGFDITSSASFSVYASNIGIQILIMSLFIIGGVGFPFIYEMIELIKAKKQGKKYKMSLVSKILITSYLVVALGGLFLAFLFEGLACINNPNSFFLTDELNMSSFERIWALIFNTFSTRSAGFSTFDLNYLSSATLFIYVVMMFIGAGSSSTTGGIRTTTFWILLIFFIKQLKGNNRVETFNRTINDSRVKQSFIIFIFSLVFVFICSLFISISFDSNNQESISFIFFTAVSAFGAVGLSLVSLSDWSVFAKLILVVLMFIGQLGISNAILQFSEPKKLNQRFLFEDVVVG